MYYKRQFCLCQDFLTNLSYYFYMRLKEIREEKGITQTMLAKAIGTSQRNIGRWESGSNEPAYSFIMKIAKFFNVSTDYLLGLEDDFGAKINSGAGTDALSKDEKKLIDDFRHLNVYSRHAILVQVEALAEKETQKN